MPDETNDNDKNGERMDGRPSLWASPNGHGQAALLLVESMLHALIENGALSIEEAADVVDNARDVHIELGDELGDDWEARRAALAFLSSIALTLRNDLR